MPRTALIALLAFTLLGCEGGVQDPSSERISMSVTEDRAPIRTAGDLFVLRPGPVFSTVEIPFVYENRTNTPYYLVHCNGLFDFRLEKQMGDEWIEAHAPVLPECLSDPAITIGPGQHWGGSIGVYVSIQEGIEPELIALEPEGTYRIVLPTLSAFDPGAYPFGPTIPKEDRVSNSFHLEVAD